MAAKLTRRQKCAVGRHTPATAAEAASDVRRGVCRYCRQPIMRTQATRIWFLATVLA